MLLVSAMLLFMFTSLARAYKKNNGLPSGFGRVLEPLILFIRDEIAIQISVRKNIENSWVIC